jgi:hypothetical protein
MTEIEIYTVKLKDKYGRKRKLEFYIRNKKGMYEAMVLGFPPGTDYEACKSDLEYHERLERLAASRTVRMRPTLIKNASGKYIDQKWDGQVALVELWRRLEELGFLALPRKNPFLGSRPEHMTVVDFDGRLKFFRRIEANLDKNLKMLREKYGKDAK